MDERPNNTDCITRPLFTAEEVRTAIRGNTDFNELKWLIQMFNNIYNTRKVTQSWVKSIFVS